MTDPETSQDSSQDVIGVVSGMNGEETLQQTFTSRRSGLNGITLWMAPQTGQAQSSLTVEIYRIEAERTVGQGEFPVFTSHISVTSRGPLQISIPPRPEPPGQRYLLFLKTASQTPVEIFGRLGDVYASGKAYQGGQPLDADLAFRASYRYGLRAAWEDLRRIAGDGWLALPLGLTFLAPGWLLLEFSGLRRRFDPGEQAALSTGLSLAVIPLAMLWTSLLGLRWSREGVMFTMGVLSALAAWRLVQPALLLKLRLGGTTPAKTAPELSLPPAGVAIALICIFLLSLAVRFAMVRDLAAPAWVDSVHHALITRLIQDSGGFPKTYAPYLGLLPTYYHAGFHSSMAVFGWLSGLDIPQTLLIGGQALNALAILAAYLLATTLLEDRLAGIIAALITGLITPMPAYYASWGRYTQLAGLLILPAALALVKQALLPGQVTTPATLILQRKKELAAALALAGLSTAGLLIVHYRVIAFLAVLLLPYLMINLIGELRGQPAAWREIGGRILLLAAALGLGSLVLTLPWVWPNLTQWMPAISQVSASPPKIFSDFSWRYLTAALGRYANVLAGAGLAWGLYQRSRFAPLLLFWVAGLFLLANLGALRLPGGFLVNNTSVEISLFLPISISGAYLLSQLFTAWDTVLPRLWRLPYRAAITILCVILAMFGIRQLLPLLNPTTFLFRQADRPALQWIKENIPQGETILINPFLWGYGVYAGNDGGFWISILAGQNTLPPPVIYGFGSQDERQEIGALCEQVIRQGSHPEELWSLLRAHHIRYLYIGARGGPLSAYALGSSPLFHMLYFREGTWVFEVKGEG